jgi:hypothetical protein
MTSFEPDDPPPEEVDFTGESDTPLPPGPTIGDKIARQRESIRAWLAGGLAALLALLDLSVLILAFLKVHPLDHDLLDILLAGIVNPVVVLVGAVLGFYFGEKAGKFSA